MLVKNSCHICCPLQRLANQILYEGLQWGKIWGAVARDESHRLCVWCKVEIIGQKHYMAFSYCFHGQEVADMYVCMLKSLHPPPSLPPPSLSFSFPLFFPPSIPPPPFLPHHPSPTPPLPSPPLPSPPGWTCGLSAVASGGGAGSSPGEGCRRRNSHAPCCLPWPGNCPFSHIRSHSQTVCFLFHSVFQ